MTTSLKLGAIDLQRPPLDVFIDKINAMNTLGLVPSDFTLSAPVEESGQTASGTYDTKISLIPSAGSVWINAKWAYYTRVSLESLLRIPTRVVTAGNPFLYDILAAVNAAYGIYLQEADVEQAAIEYATPEDTSGPGTVTITARPTSVFYTGEFTIPVNTQARQGLNTYDDEAVYYVQVDSETADTIKAYNIRGEVVDSFVAFKGATFSVCDIRHFEMLNNGDLVVIGDFVYTTTNGFGETVENTRKLIKLNPVGDIIDSAAGNVYGANYADVKRTFDKASGAVYVLDPTNSIGGRPSLVHRFNPDGSYDNLFNLGLNNPASSFCLFGADIYVATPVLGKIHVTKHNKTTGVIDATFGPVVVSGYMDAPLQIYAIAADAEGLKVVVDLVDGVRRASEPLNNNAVPMWEPGPSTAQWFNFLIFTLQGQPKPATKYWQAGLTPEFTGYLWFSEPSYALSGGWMVAPVVTFHPYYGSQSWIMVSSSPDGEVVRSVGLDPKQAPRWKNVQSVEHIENGDIVVSGEVETIGDNLEIVTGNAIALYNRLGEISTTLVVDTTPGITFKKVAGRVP